MKAIRFQEYGDPGGLKLEEVKPPQAGPGEVLISVHAASVNPVDYKIAAGKLKDDFPLSLPAIPGCDFAGVVEAVHDDVAEFMPGAEVYGSSGFSGAYAALVVVPANRIARKPATLSFVEAASVPVAAVTAWQGLFDHGQLRDGQTVLIHAAAGGVGSFAVQFAHWKGARVVATSSAANEEYLLSLGADEVIDYKTERFDTIAENVDLVLDLLGGDAQFQSFGVIRPGGRLVSTVRPPNQEEAGRHTVHAIQMFAEINTAVLDKIGRMLDNGVIRTTVTDTFPLAEASRALREIATGHTRGKLVLEVL